MKMVTKKDVDKAYNAAWGAAERFAAYAGDGEDAEDVDKAKAYNAAWDNYQKLKMEYENGN